jgi:hypothetical protein
VKLSWQILVLDGVFRRGQPEVIPGILECVDELTYAYLIHGAAKAFECLAQSRGDDDLRHLMNGVISQQKLWRKMRASVSV